MPLYSPNRSYRLVLSNDGFGNAQTMEFDALTAEAALSRVRSHCRGREVELFEDGRSLGRVRCSANGSYWILSPSPGARARSPL